jgi:hypothetical protein
MKSSVVMSLRCRRWLHFKIPAIPESVLGKYVLRLTANRIAEPALTTKRKGHGRYYEGTTKSEAYEKETD